MVDKSVGGRRFLSTARSAYYNARDYKPPSIIMASKLNPAVDHILLIGIRKKIPLYSKWN